MLNGYRLDLDKMNTLTNTATTARIEYIDLAKGFCIIFVVMLHVSNYYDVHFWLNEKITAFRMPLYYFLSGVFFKNYGGGILFKKKVNKLLIPFLFWYLSTSVLLKFFFGIVTGDNDSLWDLLTSIYYESEFFNSAIWFLLSLFYVNLLFYLCFSASNFPLFTVNNKSFGSLALVILSVGIGFCGLLLSYLHTNIPLFIDSSLTALPFFMAGFIIKKKTNLLSPNKMDKYASIIIFLCFVFISVFSDGRIKFLTNYYSHSSLISLYPCGIIGTIGLLYCAKCLKHIPFVSYLGRYSIIVLVTHELVFPRLDPMVSFLVEGDGEKFVLNLVLTLLCCFCLIPIVRRWLPYVTAQKDVFK